MTVPDILNECKNVFEERDVKYGSAYKHHGMAINGFFPEGIALKTPIDYNRFNLFNAVVAKLERHAQGFSNPKEHLDDLTDAINYMAMLAHIITEEK